MRLRWLPMRRLSMRLERLLGLWRLWWLRRLLLVLGLLPHLLRPKSLLSRVSQGRVLLDPARLCFICAAIDNSRS
jgi:hypothetical protein